MKKVMLYFGSFNPVHNGHTAVAGYVTKEKIADRLIFMVTPRNPFKEDYNLAPGDDRLAMAKIAVREQLADQPVSVSDFEFTLPRPSYTINTLHALQEIYTDTEFSVLIGSDIVNSVITWRNGEDLLRDYKFYVYPRKGHAVPTGMPNIIAINAPRYDLSSTDVRETLVAGGDISGMVSPGVMDYIRLKGLWQGRACISKRIVELTVLLDKGPAAPELYRERALLYYRIADYGNSLNDFISARELDPADTQSQEYIKLLENIFEFRYMDYYNP